MGRLATPHTQSLMIAAIAKKGVWAGTRHGIYMRLVLSEQPDLEERRITWTAYTRGNFRHRRRGQAGTVYEALQQIERALRRAIP